MDRQTVTSFPIGVHLKINTNKNLWKELEQIFDVLFMNWALVKWKNKTLTRLKIDVQRTTQWLVKALSWEGKMKSYFIKDWSSEYVGLETKQQALQHCDCSIQWAMVGRPCGEQVHSVPLPKKPGGHQSGLKVTGTEFLKSEDAGYCVLSAFRTLVIPNKTQSVFLLKKWWEHLLFFHFWHHQKIIPPHAC